MPTLQSNDGFIASMQGVHLWHYALSNCSMRVRLMLEEKGIDWIGHHVDLPKSENLTADFFRLHPKGLVPVLVHDGVHVIESNDILHYLEEAFPEPAMMPAGPEARLEVEYWLKLAADMHVDTMKTYMYGVRGNSQTEEEYREYKELQKDAELIDFHRKAIDGIPGEEVEAARAELNRLFDLLEGRLADHDWLAGEEFSLADICWLPQYVRLTTVDFPFDSFTNVLAWVDRARQRPSWAGAIAEWLP